MYPDGRYEEIGGSDMLQNVKSYTDLHDRLRCWTWAWKWRLRQSEKCGRGALCDFHGAAFCFAGARKSLLFDGFAIPLENTKVIAASGAFPRGALPLFRVHIC